MMHLREALTIHLQLLHLQLISQDQYNTLMSLIHNSTLAPNSPFASSNQVGSFMIHDPSSGIHK
ncbi:hypothetical protein A2U01_0056300, partial [Trifolium medium]|nr:hypothetical protein [Trifolium medium]